MEEGSEAACGLPEQGQAGFTEGLEPCRTGDIYLAVGPLSTRAGSLYCDCLGWPHSPEIQERTF